MTGASASFCCALLLFFLGSLPRMAGSALAWIAEGFSKPWP